MQRRLRGLRPHLLNEVGPSPRGLLLSLALLAVAPGGLAHGPAPAPLAVLGLDPDEARASLVRTSIGLAVDHPPDGWTYACPSQWGDHEQARAAATMDGGLVVTVGGGGIYRSVDGACHFDPVAVDGGEDWYALDTFTWSDRIWVPATLGIGGDVGGLLVVGTEGLAAVARRWEGEEAFRADALLGWSSGGAQGLLVTGASPGPALWRADGAPDSPLSLTWSREPLDLLGEPEDDISHIDVRSVSDDGRIWLAVTSLEGRRLWLGAPDGAGPMTWEPSGAAAASLHGPVDVAGQWSAVRDGVAEVLTLDAGWQPLAEVDWTCLRMLGDVPIACTLRTALVVEALDGDEIETRTVFEMTDLMAPLEGCPGDSDGTAACQGDWIHFGAEAGLLDPARLSTPSERGGGSPLPADDHARGCSVTRTRGLFLSFLLVVLALVASSRYRSNSSRRPRRRATIFPLR